jgi:hypothetical protein
MLDSILINLDNRLIITQFKDFNKDFNIKFLYLVQKTQKGNLKNKTPLALALFSIKKIKRKGKYVMQKNLINI